MKTVFITGASSGIGRSTAIYFHQRGWRVIATMRNPKDGYLLAELSNVIVLKLDVTDKKAVKRVCKQAADKYDVDTVVANAGYGLFGAVEDLSETDIQKQFEVNVFGAIRTMQAFMEHFRNKRSGTLVAVSSVVGKVGMPFASAYASSKFAIEGFMESLQYEAALYNVSCKIIEPGPIDTDFFTRSLAFKQPTAHKYKIASNKIKRFFDQAQKVQPEEAAEVIYKATTDGSDKLRYVVGNEARSTLQLKRVMPETFFFANLRQRFD